jgi:hypothetical protein
MPIRRVPALPVPLGRLKILASSFIMGTAEVEAARMEFPVPVQQTGGGPEDARDK